MIKQVTIAALVLMLGASAFGDYETEYKAADKLYRARMYVEALDEFMALAEKTDDKVQKSNALERAALTIHRLKHYDKAIELAKQIPLEHNSKACQIKIMDSARHKSKELLAAFKDEDLSNWPNTLAGPAYFARGRAFYRVRQGKRAVEDLAKAAELLTDSNPKGLAYNTLGDAWRDLMKDTDKAIASYRKTLKVSAIYKECYAAMSIAKILAERGKFEEAHAELAKIDMEKVTHPAWRVNMLGAKAELLAKEGRKAEAIAEYEEVLKVQGINDKTKAVYEKKIEALKAVE
jgi:tetratricopeptide (TPR) repeat protein